jgi:hypothetical protein
MEIIINGVLIELIDFNYILMDKYKRGMSKETSLPNSPICFVISTALLRFVQRKSSFRPFEVRH